MLVKMHTQHTHTHTHTDAYMVSLFFFSNPLYYQMEAMILNPETISDFSPKSISNRLGNLVESMTSLCIECFPSWFFSQSVILNRLTSVSISNARIIFQCSSKIYSSMLKIWEFFSNFTFTWVSVSEKFLMSSSYTV